MKRIELGSEWLANWTPKRKDEEIADRGCKGLVVRGQPGGVKTFYRWTNARDERTGAIRRKRVRLGRWPALSLGEARKTVNDAKDAATSEGGGDSTVAALADAYRRDVLARCEPGSAAWSWGIIRTHILAARPNPKAPPFGEWPARSVKPPDVAAVVRAARVERTAEVAGVKGGTVARRLGGPAAARATLRELKAIFSAAVGAGSLEMTPAGVLQAKALGLKKTPRGRKLDADELAALFKALDLNAILDGTAKKEPGVKLTATIRLGIALLYYLPVRSHSLVSAEWKEIDLDAARWTVPVGKLKLHREDRATARPLTVPLPGTALAILRRLRELAGEAPWVLASPTGPKKELPTTPKKSARHIAPKALVRALVRLQESGRLALGSRFTIHDARRTWRSWAGELGVSFEVAEKSLGHVLPGVAETYARADLIEQRAAAAELVAAAFDRVRLGKSAGVVPMEEGKARRREVGAAK